MNLETFRRIIRFGAQNYMRNGWLSLAATLIVAMTLFIVAVFTLNTYVTKQTARSVQDKLDMAVYINDGPSEDDVANFIKEVKAYPEVKQLDYLDKQEVIAEWNQLTIVTAQIKNQVTDQNNPLPRTIKIKAYDANQLGTIAAKISKSSFAPNIRKVDYQDNAPLIRQLVAQSQKMIKNGIIVSTIFIIIAILFVYNTIRVMIRLRQDEFGIMKLVGASDAFVRGPFIVEGTLYGVFGGILALIGLYIYLQNGLSDTTTFAANVNTGMAQQLIALYHTYFFLIAAAMIGLGVLLAVLCAWVSMGRHLKNAA